MWPQFTHLKQRSPPASAVPLPQAPQKRCVRAHSAICTARIATPSKPSSSSPNSERRPRQP